MTGTLGAPGLLQAKRTKPISPSKLPFFAQCALRYVLETERPRVPTIPAGLAALRGTAIHAVIEENVGHSVPESSELRKRFLEIAETAARQQGNALMLKAMLAAGMNALFPARLVLADMQFIRSVLTRHYRKQHGSEAAAGRRGSGKALGGRFGAERQLASVSLDMEGRPDLLYKDENGLVHVAEFKSGKVTGPDGLPKEAYLVQIAAYGLLVKELWSPPGEVALELAGPSSAWEGKLDEQLEKPVTSLLAGLRERLPKHVQLDAAELASPGLHCHSCAYRPACPAYLAALDAQAPDVSPCDIAGMVLEVEHQQEAVSLRVKSQHGRTVAIRGIPEPVESALEPGSYIRAFSLGIFDILPKAAFPANFFAYRSDDPRQSSFGAFVSVVERKN